LTNAERKRADNQRRAALHPPLECRFELPRSGSRGTPALGRDFRAGQAPASSSPRQWAGTPGLLFAVVEWGSPVAPRLGNVLYALACILAVLILALGATVFFLANPSSKAGQNPITVLVVSVVVAVLIWLIGEGLRYILAGTSTHAKLEQLEERLVALEQRIDAVDARLTRYEDTVGPQLKTLGSLLHQALSKRDRASHNG
jgi:hypothetical protein